jgi:UDP-N-acetylmuramate--alanine ligase
MNLTDNIKNVFFLGIGGIGMSALARFFKQEGKFVAGYDKTPSPLTKQLEEEGIGVHYSDDPKNIPSQVIEDKNSLIVFTPAIPDTNQEKAMFMQAPYRMMKRAQVLGVLGEKYQTLAVAGTHGKTSISTMLAHLMQYGEEKAHAFLGGISSNYKTNYIHAGDSPYMVVEADEFDRSFLHLHPSASIISMVDADHLDIYGNKEGLEKSFRKFVDQTQDMLIVRSDNKLSEGPDKVFTYSLRDNRADFYTSNLRKTGLCYDFDLHTPDQVIEGFSMAVPGLLNVENMVAALAMAYLHDVKPDKLKEAVAAFRGIWRRFEIVYKDSQRVYIDDYAHHPEEIRRTLTSLKELFPGKRLTGVFQPHLYSRTRDFALGFARSLDMLDECILLPVYPARELPIEGVDSKLIADKMTTTKPHLMDKEQMLEYISENQPEVLISLGAGDIDRLTEPLKLRMSE